MAEWNDIESAVAAVRRDLPGLSDETAPLLAKTIRKLIRGAAADCMAAGFDPSDPRDVVAGKERSSAVAFVFACREASTTLRFWREHDNQSTTLDAVLDTGKLWMAEASVAATRNDLARAAVDRLNAKIVAQDAERSNRRLERTSCQHATERQQGGVSSTDPSPAEATQQRDDRAWQLLDNPGNARAFFAAIQAAPDDVIAELAKLFEKESPKAFREQALDPYSALRHRLQETVKRMR